MFFNAVESVFQFGDKKGYDMLTRNRLTAIPKENENLLDQYSVKSVSVFGSIARGEAESKNDTDSNISAMP